MGSTNGRASAPLSRRLVDESGRFDFFQAVRLLERLARRETAPAERPRYPVGQDYPPAQEAVRFRGLASHSFPAAAIVRIQEDAAQAMGQRRPPEMTVPALGLFGPQGALPRHYTSLVIARIRDKDYALRDFLDLFNHRLVSLFYRAWEKYRFFLGYERSHLDEAEAEEPFTQAVYCLVGMGTRGLRRRMEFDDEALLYYAGHFVQGPRGAVSLEILLADYFQLPVEVRQFQGQWLYLDPGDCSALPGAGPRGQNNQLGRSLIAGQRVWDVEGKFRVRLGPLGYRDFRRFMPSGESLKPLCRMLRHYAGAQFEFDVQLVLLAGEVPWCRLGGDTADPARLGWNTWIRSGPFEHDVDDAVFTLEV